MNPPSVCVAGTWDPDFHRNRNLLRLLELAGCEIKICRVDLWGERGGALVRSRKLKVFLRALVAMPLLIWKFLRTPRSDVVLILYPGHFDVLFLAPLCWLRGTPLVLDIFISLFDTIVSDRGLAAPHSPLGMMSRSIDRMACRLADRILADTPPHAEFLSEMSGVSQDQFRVQWLGAQEDLFCPQPEVTPDPDLVLFHGTFIQLQGLDTIIRAAAELESDGVQIRLVGDGQERPAAKALASELGLNNLEWAGLIPLEQVPGEIARAGICLGIFGTTGKADRVVPNKLYECLAVGRPVVTADTAAVRSAFDDHEVVTVPPGDDGALAAAVRRLHRNPELRKLTAAAGHRRFRQDYSQEVLAPRLKNYLLEAGS